LWKCPVSPFQFGTGNPKRRGEAGEAAFLAKASSLGFSVSKPWGDSDRYDFVLDSGHGLLRVQVKSVSCYSRSRYSVKASGNTALYTKAEINDPNATAQAAGFYPGIKIINVPQYTAVAALDYQHPVNDSLAAVFHVSSSLVGPIEDQAYFRETLPSHNIVDLKAGVTGPQWGAYVFATNLTNKIAALTINNTVFAWQQPTITRVSTNQPRTIGVDVRYKF